MKKVIYFLIFSCLALPVYCNEYQETVVSGKKIITAISQEDSLQKFGIPAKGSLDYWYYDGVEPFYVYFPKTVYKPTLLVFPYSYSAKVGTPFEIKAFVLYPNSHIDDVTEYVNWIITDKSKVEQEKNFFIPLNDGNIKILAAYRNIISNACNIAMGLPVKKKNEGHENLLAINIFPHKPVVGEKQDLTFIAFGTFFDSLIGKISVKNISKDVNWFVQNEQGVQKKQQRIYFMLPGKETVFCEYKGIKSNIQEIVIKKGSLNCQEKIKNIRVLPEFAKVDTGVEIDMQVIASYDNGRVEHRGAISSWQIDDKKVINFVDNGTVRSEKEGIANVYVSLDSLLHSSSKILVTKKVFVKEPETNGINYSPAEDTQPEPNAKDLANSIRKTIRMLNPESIKIKHIRVKPEALTLPLGHTANLTAEAVYSDNSTVDAISFVKWKNTNPENVTIKQGKLLTHSQGNTSIYAYLEEIKSNLSKITVVEPELVSIALDPQELKLEVGDTELFRTYGYYSDSSKKNIINEINWVIEYKNLLEIDKEGRLKAKKKGTTDIYAQYGKIRSLPATVKIFISFLTIFKKSIGIFLTLCLGAYLLFHLLLKVKVIKLKKLIAINPSKFIKSLYQNSRKVLGIFGNPYQNTVPALNYAETVEKKFSINNNCFTDLTYIFFETQYSSHVISTRDAIRSLDRYNQFMKGIKKNSSGFLFKSWILFICGYPFSV